MRTRIGLSARFAMLAVVVLACVLGMVALVWDRQEAMHREAQELSVQAISEFSSTRLLSRGQAATVQLAESLVNPVYYFDLDAIGVAVRAVLRQPDVSYVIVYDNEGQVIHDGSPDISTYGQTMSDPFAYEVLGLEAAHVQSNDTLVDIAAPIRIGDQRLGGVRVGYSLAAVKAEEARVGGVMASRLQAIGRSQLLWLGVLLVGMVGLLVTIGVVLQRSLVSPVQQMADAARQIEAGTLDADVPASRRKDEVGDMAKASWLIARAPETFGVWSGDDKNCLPLLSVGGVGLISVASHLVGDDLARMIEVFPTDPAEARRIHLKLLHLFEALFVEPSPGPLKAALRLVGMDVGEVRLPLVMPVEETEDVLREALASAGVTVTDGGGP